MARSKEEVVQEFRVQSIRDAAMRVIARKGMAAATMQEIADEAGIAKGTIYLYFRDREDVVEKAFENSMNDLHQRVDEALETPGTFEQKLRAVLAAQIGFFQTNREFFRLYISLRYPEGNAQQQRINEFHAATCCRHSRGASCAGWRRAAQITTAETKCAGGEKEEVVFPRVSSEAKDPYAQNARAGELSSLN